MEELLSLKWNNHRSTFLHILTILRNKQLYTDATLACDGRFYSVHKLVLSTCSDYFSAMFDRTTCKNPIIVLKDIKCEDLESLLDYMYLGEVNVRQTDLASLIKAAECLRVKGLAVPDDEPSKRSGRSDGAKRTDSSPPPKRKRRDMDDGRDDVKPSSNIISSTPKNSDIQGHGPSQDMSDYGTSSLLEGGASDTNFIKTEIVDNIEGGDPDDAYRLDDDTFKDEPNSDAGGELSNDLPEFLQQSPNSYSHSFPGTSFQSDMQNWQGDGVLPSNYSGYGLSAAQDGSQNTSAGGDTVPSRNSSSSSASGGLWDCSICGRGFSRHWHLKRHLATHLAIKPYSCPHCPHAANIKANLALHIRKMHSDKPQLPAINMFAW